MIFISNQIKKTPKTENPKLIRTYYRRLTTKKNEIMREEI